MLCDKNTDASISPFPTRGPSAASQLPFATTIKHNKEKEAILYLFLPKQ